MYEGLIEFIESSLFSVINKIGAEEQSGLKQVELIMALLLGFAQKNRGLTRVLIGDALVHENDRLQARINQLLDRVEASLKQALRIAATKDEVPAGARLRCRGQSADVLRGRALAPFRQERLRARTAGAVAAAVADAARLLCGRAGRHVASHAPSQAVFPAPDRGVTRPFLPV